MKQGLILMFILSLLGHIAAAGMLYVAGAYGVWDNPPRDGMDAQKGDAIRVLWGFAEETPMSLRGTKGHGNNPPYSPFIKGGDLFPPPPLEKGGKGGFDQRMSSDESLRFGLKSSAEESRPAAPTEPLLHPGSEADNAGLYGRPIVEDQPSHDEDTMRSLGLYGYHPDPAGETGTSSAGLYDRHSGAEANGVVQEEQNAQPSGGNPDSSAPSMASMGTGGDCSSSAACMGANVAASEVYPGIDEAGNSGRGNRGAGLKTFLEALRAEIERHKNYPPFARNNGIEGTAYLNFHIGDNGRPDGIILEKSSGSKLLDESAIRTLKGMERFYPVPEEIRELEITVPIAYRLVENAEKIKKGGD